MDRRTFCKASLTLGTAALTWPVNIHAQDAAAWPDLVAIKNGTPGGMFDQAIAALGGMERFVKPGQTVVVKPNIGWNRGPETAANTNPQLVQRVVEHCVQAGAKKVYVFDHVINEDLESKTYATTGIEAAAKAGGAMMAPGNAKKYYQEVSVGGSHRLGRVFVHELILEANVLINVPVLKHHSSAQITAAMKNLMGVVWDRMSYHLWGLHHCISDFCLLRAPNLNIVDAYVVTMANGPQRSRPEDLVTMKSLLISPDIVAIDAAAAKLWGVEPESVKYIRLAHEKQLGNMHLNELKIQKIVL